MQALRKPAPLQAPVETSVPADAEGYTGPDRRQPRGMYDSARSPALALRHHLTARLEDLAQVPDTGAAVLAEPTVKLPIPARAAVIVGLSLSLWAGVYLAAAAIL